MRRARRRINGRERLAYTERGDVRQETTKHMRGSCGQSDERSVTACMKEGQAGGMLGPSIIPIRKSASGRGLALAAITTMQ